MLPTGMASHYVSELRFQILPSNPPIEKGRLFLGSRASVEDLKVGAIERSLRRVLEELD